VREENGPSLQSQSSIPHNAVNGTPEVFSKIKQFGGVTVFGVILKKT
jgi:hypothetical protein